MIDLAQLDDLARRLGDLLPSQSPETRFELERRVRNALQAGLGRLDLVTRGEFDVQRAVLLRTREKLDLLERILVDIEARLDALAPGTRN